MKNTIYSILTLSLFINSCCSNSIDKKPKIIKVDKDTLDSSPIDSIKDATPFITYSQNINNKEQIPFKTKVLTKARVVIFSNFGDRKGNHFQQINNVYGINQFFMDFDLTSGYIHNNTQNFYNRLKGDDFVLYFEKDIQYVNKGIISYKRKRDLTQTDLLGQNVGFFRQWKLSDIDLTQNQILMKRSGKQNYFCPQVKIDSKNVFKPEIPIWSVQVNKDGYVGINNLNVLSNNNGGTVTIIWETKDLGIVFKDVHGSIEDITNELNQIKTNYKVDPVLGIYDAAPMARKFKSDEKHMIDFDKINSQICNIWYVGAGYCYDLNQ